MRLFALSFVLGVLVLQHAAALPEWRVALAGCATALAFGLVPSRMRVVRALVAVAAGALLGHGFAAWRAEVRLADELPREWEGRDVSIVGVVAGLPQSGEKGTRFVFDVERAGTPGAIVPRRISLTWYPERVKGAEPMPPPVLRAAERWQLTVRLKRPRGLANPHGFDFEPWALERGIRATGYVRSREEFVRVDERVAGFWYTVHRWREEVRDGMRARLKDARLGGVLFALAIGDQDAIAAQDWEVFWRTGVGHLMSISGLHITMIAGVAFLAAFAAWARVPALALAWPARKAAIVAGTLAALGYSLMTGFAVPAQRTFVMLAAIAACVLADRHGSPSRVLALAALAVVVVDPWAVLSAGFWLSFGAVAAIFYVVSLRTGRTGRLHSALLEQLAVTLAMIPMLVALFQEVSLVSPLANAFAIPVVTLIVVPLTLAGALLPLPFLLDAAHAVMAWCMGPLEWLAALPLAMLESHAPRGWTVAAALVGVAWLLAPRGVPMRAAGFVWMAPLFLVLPPSPLPGEAWVEMLDVGHGLAIVVRTAGHAMAYDAGPSWSAESDSGSRVVVPFLRGEGVARLDGLVVSHADDDHYGGAASVALSRRPAWLLSPLAPDDPLHHAVEASRRCEAGQRWAWDGVEFLVLHPDAGMYGEAPRRRARKENDRGCVLRVATRGAAALIAADVEALGESEMLARDAAALRADVLVVPHHGSKTSSSAAFVDAVSPKVALVSVAWRNRFRHPHESVVARYASRGIPLHRTDLEGAVRVVLPAAAGNALVRSRAREVRYWSERRSLAEVPSP